MRNIRSVYIVAGKRTPIGSQLGSLSHLHATELGGIAIKGAIDSIKLPAKEVDEVILGNVLSAALGQAPARQACLKGGLGDVSCTTINKVCSSGLKSLVYGSQSIALGQSDTVVAGGFESMSQAPFFVAGARRGLGFGDKKLFDAVFHDGLTDAINKTSMGSCAEKTVADFKITREAQDDYCKLSYTRANEATEAGHLANDIVPVPLKGKDFAEDEELKKYNGDKVPQLPAVFSKTGGTITAANASKISDGACSMILMSEEKMKSLNLKPLARIVNYADHEVEPIDFSIAPHYAAKKVLKLAGLKTQNIDFFEFNEAFSSVAVVNMKLLDISEDITNVFGGAVALGHPIGASGARILLNLINILKIKGGRYGLAGICNGGGGSTAMIIENMQ